MKTIAYICDCCEKVFLEEDIFTLKAEPMNMFSGIIGYEYNTINSVSDKYRVHYCLSCYTEKVTDLLETHRINRLENESEYAYYLNLYRNNFFKKIHHNSLCRKR